MNKNNGPFEDNACVIEKAANVKISQLLEKNRDLQHCVIGYFPMIGSSLEERTVATIERYM